MAIHLRLGRNYRRLRGCEETERASEQGIDFCNGNLFLIRLMDCPGLCIYKYERARSFGICNAEGLNLSQAIGFSCIIDGRCGPAILACVRLRRVADLPKIRDRYYMHFL